MDINRAHWLSIDERPRGGFVFYIRPARSAVLCDMNGRPLDYEMSETLVRGRLAEFIDMDARGAA